MQENYPVLIAQNELKTKFEHFKKIPVQSEEFVIGRSSDSSVVITANHISKKHCIFKKVTDTEWSIEDCSTAGIQVNKTKMRKHSMLKLQHNDIIRLDPDGEFIYKFITNTEDDDEDERPRKRAKYNNVENDRNTVNEQPNQSNTSKCKNRIEKDTVKRVKDLVDTFAGQIGRLQGEGSQSQEQNKEEQLNLVKMKMEEKICSEIMAPLKEIAELRTKLLKKQEMFMEKLTRHETTRQALRHQLEARIQEKEREQNEKEKLKGDLEQVNSQLKSVETEKNALERLSDAARHAALSELGAVLEAELACAVCAGLLVAATTLGCRHMFCTYCINQWKRKKNECPLCRANITSECRSLVLDSFIEKMVANLTDDVKIRRQAALKDREEAERLALQNPAAGDAASDASDSDNFNVDVDSDTSSEWVPGGGSDSDMDDIRERFMMPFGYYSESEYDSGNLDNSRSITSDSDYNEGSDFNGESNENSNESGDGEENESNDNNGGSGNEDEDGNESVHEDGNERVNEDGSHEGSDNDNQDGIESVNEDNGSINEYVSHEEGSDNDNQDGNESVNEDNGSINEYVSHEEDSDNDNQDGNESVNEDNESINEYVSHEEDSDNYNQDGNESVNEDNESITNISHEEGSDNDNDDCNQSVNEDSNESNNEDDNNQSNDDDDDGSYNGSEEVQSDNENEQVESGNENESHEECSDNEEDDDNDYDDGDANSNNDENSNGDENYSINSDSDDW